VVCRSGAVWGISGKYIPALAIQRIGGAARVRALAAYKDFLALWKDADPDIPIYREAKAEYAKLQ
jgi:hypothetical protein